MKANSFNTESRSLAGRYGECGMTGLETAIILIAFVTVAAVFGYAVLSAGLFSAEQHKESIYAGLKQVKSNLDISGSVTACSDNSTAPPAKIREIRFTLRNGIAGAPIDMTPNLVDVNHANKCVISLANPRTYCNNVQWRSEKVSKHDNDELLEAGEQFEIIIDLTNLGTGIADPGIGPNDWFSIQVKPPLGSTVTIQRTLPGSLDKFINLL